MDLMENDMTLTGNEGGGRPLEWPRYNCMGQMTEEVM